MRELKFIGKYLRAHWVLASIAPLCVLLEVWAELEQPDLMSQIVDRGILGGESDMVLPTGVKMVAILLIGVVGGILSIVAAGRVSYAFGADLRKALYVRITDLSFSNVDRLDPSSLITRMGDDVTRVQQLVQEAMRLLFRAPFLFVGAVVMALMINVHVSVVLVFLMAVSFLVVIFIMRSTLPLFVDQQKKRDGLVGVIQEILIGIRVIKAYISEPSETAKFDKGNEALLDSNLRAGRMTSFMMPVVSFALNVGIICVIYLGAGEVVSGDMQIGGIMATINYLAQVQMALMMASHVIMSMTQAQASIDRLLEVLETPSEPDTDRELRGGKSPVAFRNGDIEFRGVTFSYSAAPDAVPQLEDVSFSLRQGETLAVLGETGSGKSTIISLLSRFYDVSQGGIFIGGVDVREMDRKELQKHVGVVMQKNILFGGTIAENLRMGGAEATDAELTEACRIVQMSDFVEQQKDGLEYHLEQGAQNLSGGQKQRFSIARTLLAKPDIMILDDSFCSLDLLTESKIKNELDKVECTKIIVAQRISSIRNANKILLLKAGKVEALGTHDELMKTSETYRETYRAQTGKED